MNENPSNSIYKLVYFLIGAVVLLLGAVIYLYLSFYSKLSNIEPINVVELGSLPREGELVEAKPLTEVGLAVDFVDGLFENEKSTQGSIVRIDVASRSITIEGSITDLQKVLAGDYQFGTELPRRNRNFVLSVDRRVNLADFKIGDQVVVLTDNSLHLDEGVSIMEMIKLDFEREEPWAP
jgi:hypothetical protein